MNKEERAGAIWNIVGSTLYAFTSMLLGTLVIRILGADPGGIFFFAFSTMGQHLYVVSYFGMRPVQSTDHAGEFTFGDYRRIRFFTAGAALIIGIVAAFIYAGFSYKAAVIILVALYRIIDGFADVYESEFQRQGRLDLTGKSLTFRTLIVLVVFLLAILLTQNLIITCVAMVVALLDAFYICCMRTIDELPKADNKVTEGSTKKLFDQCIWLFLSLFLDFYLFAAGKYAVDAQMSSSMSGYYSTLFVPASVMNLLANFIIRPLLPKFSDAFAKGDKGAIRKMIFGSSAVILGATFIAAAAAYFIGVPVLGIFAGPEAQAAMEPYRMTLALIVIGGGLYAFMSPLYYVLIIAKQQKAIFRIYLAATVVGFAVSSIFVKNWGLNGAAWSLIVSMLVLETAFIIHGRKTI